MTVNSLAYKDIQGFLPRRFKNSHKGQYGKVLVVGGDAGMGGAAILTSESALMSGAGLITLLTKKENVTASLLRLPEVMTYDISNFIKFCSYFEGIDTVVCGIGFGDSEWSKEAFIKTIECCKDKHINLIIDAGALRLLSKINTENTQLPKNLILTPHPGEAADLLNRSVKYVQENRISCAKELNEKFKAHVILKGYQTIIFSNKIYKCQEGGPELAIPGSGDVLAGLISSMVSQNINIEDACRIAVAVHGKAGNDYRDEHGEIGLKSSELIQNIRKRINL